MRLTLKATPLKFSYLDYNTYVGVCSCIDYVRLFLDLERPELDAGRRPSLELCGNQSAISGSRQRLDDQPIYSSGRSLVLEFHSGHVQRNHSGFIGRYRFIDTGWSARPSVCYSAANLF